METSSLTKKQLEQRLLTLYQASLQLVQDFSIDSLLEKVANLACKETEARFGAVLLVDEKKNIQSFVPVGLSREEYDRVTHLPQGKGLITEVLNSETPIRLADVSGDPRFEGLPFGHPGIKSFLGVAIRQGTTIMGEILLAEKTNNMEFGEDDGIVMEMLAGYASASLTNARLYKDLIQRDQALTRRNEDLALLNQLASTLATSTDISQILEKGLSQLMDYLRLEAGEIYLRKEESRTLVLKVRKSNSGSGLWVRDQYIVGENVVGKTVKSGIPVLLDVADCDCDELAPDIKEHGIHQIAVVPLSGRRGTIGALCVATCHPQPLDELEVQFLQAIGSWMATAIENVKLNLQGRRLAVLEERERIGMDLHDGIIQSIYAVGLTLEHAGLLMKEDPAQANKRIEQAKADLNATIRDIRAYILDLRPRQLHNEDLMSGINRLLAEFHANTLVDVHMQGPDEDISHLPKNQAVSLFHICQEALANIAKHAHAHKVEVVVWTTNDRLLMEIRDDGVGFNTDTTKISLGHGLSNMETRSTNAGGEVDITSEPGKGTSILAWVPYSEDESLVVE